MKTSEFDWKMALLGRFGAPPNGHDREAEAGRPGPSLNVPLPQKTPVIGRVPGPVTKVPGPVTKVPRIVPAEPPPTRLLPHRPRPGVIKTRPGWDIGLVPRLPIRPVLPVPSATPPITSGGFQLWAMPELDTAFFALTAPRLEAFAIIVRVDNVGGTLKVTGADATLTVSVYAEDTASQMEQNRQAWSAALAQTGHGQRNWDFRPLLLNALSASLGLPPEYLRAPAAVNASSDVGTASIQAPLSELGALAFEAAIKEGRIATLGGTCTANARFLAQNGRRVAAREQNLTTPLSALLAGVGPDSLTRVNPQVAVEAQVTVYGHSVLQSAVVNWAPSEGHRSESLTFGAAGGSFKADITSAALDRVVIDWNAAVQFRPTGWPLIPLNGQQKFADNDFHLVIKPDSWIVTYLLMVLLVDASGAVLPASEPMNPEDRVQGEVSYSAPYLAGGVPLTTVFETSSQQALQIAVPLPPGAAFGEVRLTLFALRGGKDAMVKRVLKVGETYAVARVAPDARITIDTNLDPVEELSEAGMVLNAFAALTPQA